MYRKPYHKLLSLLLVFSMILSTFGLSGCASDPEEKVVTLNVCSMLANFSGMQTGWMADVLKEKLNIRLNIISEGSNTMEARLQTGDLGDIVVWGNDDNLYARAVKDGLLYDWDKEDLLAKEGAYIEEHMEAALKKNRKLTSTITDGKEDTLYGFGNSVATSKEDHEPHIYTWDIRWDLYKELGYPEVKNLNDLEKLLKNMCEICPKNDSDEPTYAFTTWPDWDDAMVMYVKAAATAYYGYDEFGIGLYDPRTGDFHGALEENGAYLDLLKFFNNLYQDGILDPNSMTQNYEDASAKMRTGTAMCSIFNYAGQSLYNTTEHMKNGKAMLSMCPEEACPLGYGASVEGKERIWSIGASTKHPELCMQFLNYLCTPEGRLTTEYGPEGLCWEYDSDKNTSLTELGKECRKDTKKKLEHGYTGTFSDGELHISNETWSIDATNPESNGETYNFNNWASASEDSISAIEKEWQEKTGAANSNEYIDSKKHVITPASDYHMSEKSEDLRFVWDRVTKELKDSCWKAIYAKNDAEYDKIVKNMIKACKKAGYEECADWCIEEAEKRYEAEKAVGN